jgi:hypothetical protein
MPHIKTVTTKVATKLPTAAYTAVYLVADCDVTGKQEDISTMKTMLTI